MGNINTLHQLNRMKQEDKDKMVKNWISVSPVFLGSMKAYMNLLGGESNLLIVKHVFGLDFKASVLGTHNMTGLWELIQYNPF